MTALAVAVLASSVLCMVLAAKDLEESARTAALIFVLSSVALAIAELVT